MKKPAPKTIGTCSTTTYRWQTRRTSEPTLSAGGAQAKNAAHILGPRLTAADAYRDTLHFPALMPNSENPEIDSLARGRIAAAIRVELVVAGRPFPRKMRK